MNLTNFILFICISTICYVADGQSNEILYDYTGTLRKLNKISTLADKDSLAIQSSKFISSSIRHLLSTDSSTLLQNHFRNISQLNEYAQRNSSGCLPDILKLFYSLSQGKPWAINMIDAWGKMPSGVLSGNTKWMGRYDECLTIASDGLHQQDYETSNSTTVPPRHTIAGQYCSVQMGNNSANYTPSVYDLTITMGLCLPSTCSALEVAGLINTLFYPIHGVGVLSASCSMGEKKPFSTGAIVVMVLLSIYGSVLMICTVYDVIMTSYRKRIDDSLPVNQSGRQDDDDDVDDNVVGSQESVLLDDAETNVKPAPSGNLHKAAIALSLYSNGYSILRVDSVSDKSLSSLHGIRFLSMSWVILGHSVMMSVQNMENLLDLIPFVRRYAAQAIINATPSVDTFFVLSGTLVSYLLLMEISTFEGSLWRFSWIKFYFHRFWRLTPLYMIVLAFFTTLFVYTGDGPMWSLGADVEHCQQTWWTNLLYINNIVDLDKTCIGWTWYLANDMQFFLLAPLLILLLYRLPVAGYVVSVILMIANSVTVGVITYVHKYPAEMPELINGKVDPSISAQWNKDVYWVPWCRYGPYVVGVTLGYIIFRTRRNLRMHWALAIVGWCVAAVCNLSIIYGLHGSANGEPLSVPVASLYAGVHRTVWALGVAWVILACVSGYGGFVNTLLSWSPFVVLSRLTYSAYMIHILILVWIVGSSRDVFYFNSTSLVCFYLAHLVLSYMAAFVVSLTIEAPMIALERAFLRKQKA